MKRVMVVDDNQSNLYLLQVLLTGHGYEVESALNGSEALEKARTTPPDLLISDILMPVMDGFTLCQKWKTDPDLKKIPFIFYTATYTDPKDEKFGLSLGAERFIVKPAEPDDFLKIIGEVLDEAEQGRITPGRVSLSDEAEYFRHHNRALIKKLEDKMVQLEEINRQLKGQLEQRKQAEMERVKLERRLRQAEKMEALGNLAGGIAHDFNNILSAILGYSEMILRDLEPDNPQRDRLSKVFQAGLRARDLVNQILNFSRQSELERKPIDLKTIVAESLELFRPSLPLDIELKNELSQVPSTILADPTQIQQVVINLCTNAAQAMAESGGTLGVALRRMEIGGKSDPAYVNLEPGEYLVLSVSDTGHGMSKATAQRIFDPFFTTKQRGEGTGLGLAMVQAIVNNHRGLVAVRSDPGKGSNFRVFLPAISQEELRREDLDSVSVIPRGTERVLFVDDEKVLVELGCEMLSKLGYRVTGLVDSPSALRLFMDKPDDFDVLITDVTMPRLTGPELAREARKARPNLPIILCTGFSETITNRQGGSGEIDRVIMKPLTMRELGSSIRQALGEGPPDN